MVFRRSRRLKVKIKVDPGAKVADDFITSMW